MIYSGYELLWLFCVSSFLGWGLETVNAAVRKKRFVNRGLVNGPFCVIYGITAVINAVVLQELPVFWVFVGAAILATVVEWIGGHLLEAVCHTRWWDYSKMKWNLDGYICLPVSILWGALGAAAVLWGNDLCLKLYHWIPKTPANITLLAIVILLILDAAATLIIISGKSKNLQRWKMLDLWFENAAKRMEDQVYAWVDRQLETIEKEESEEGDSKAGVFAAGCSFYKIVLLFIIGSFLGDIVETIFCRVRVGVWMSRSSLVWGPFSIVWGFGVAALTALLYRYRNNSDRFLFLTGTVLGGAYEYLCSVLSELVFGTVFWDYSEIPFNLGGRINLLYCMFWGIAVVVWFKGLYPKFSCWIEKIPKKTGTVVTWILIVFMCCNMAVSFLALVRSNERSQGIEAEYSWQKAMDTYYDDDVLEKIYPNAIRVEE